MDYSRHLRRLTPAAFLFSAALAFGAIPNAASGAMDAKPVVSLGVPARVMEGAGQITVTATLNRPASEPVQVAILLGLSTASSPRSLDTLSIDEVVLRSKPFPRLIYAVIPAGETAVELGIPLLDDDIPERNERAHFYLLNAKDARLGTRLVSVVIQDDEPRFELNILHINDHHSHVEPNTGASLEFDGVETDVETGGFPRVVAKIDELEAGLDNVLKLHAGDAITGTIYYSLFFGEADARLMNQVCFDALAVGNHEFDDGDAGLARFIGFLNGNPELCRTAILAANVEPAPATPLRPDGRSGLLRPYVIKEVGGEQIGIIGINISGKTRNSSSPLASTRFLDEAQTAQHFIDELTGRGVDKIVLLTHFQYENDLELASKLRGVDVIVGGDSHSLLGDGFAAFGLNPRGPYPTVAEDAEGRQVCVVQAWQFAEVVGELNAAFNDAGEIVGCGGTPHLLLGDTFAREDAELVGDERQAVLDLIAATPELSIVAPDSVSQSMLDVFAEEVDVLKTTVIGVVGEDLCLERIPGQGRSAICDPKATQANGGDIQQLVTQAFLARSFEADIALQNAGGVRVDIPAGDITINDAFTLLPFANTLVNLELTGAEIKQVLEESVSNFLDTDDGSTGSYPYAANLRWHVDLGQPAGERFSNIEIRRRGSDAWLPLADDDVVKTVTNSFLAGGRDGWFTFGDVSDAGRVTDTFIDYAQAFIDYVEQDLQGIVEPPACENYSTQLFTDIDGTTLLPDAAFPRACE